MTIFAVEAVAAGSKPPVVVRVRISTGERHGFGAAASLSTGRHLLNKGESEVRWSHHQSWSDKSGRDRPPRKKRYPHLLITRSAAAPFIHL